MRTSLVALLALAVGARTFASCGAQSREPAAVRIGVFSLFHPATLTLRSDRAMILTLSSGKLVVTPSEQVTFHATSSSIRVEIAGLINTGSTDATTCRSISVASSSFTLTVPGQITRSFTGSLNVRGEGSTLSPTITLPTELAVASIVAAESPPHAPQEALRAQAIVSRSFLLARLSGHKTYDACDTTHCQFLRSPPPPSSAAARAARATRGLVLTWQASPDAPASIVPAMYSRSCGGHTRARALPGAYPFLAVRCSFCLRHPELWTRPTPNLTSGTEHARIGFNRLHGWAAIPSNNYTQTGTTLEGKGTGHGLGLCQVGAADLAARGMNSQQILAHFFPNTRVTALD